MKFVGDLNDFGEERQKHLEDILIENEIKVDTVNISQVGKLGDNHIANVKRVIVEDDVKGTVKIIVKVAPSMEAVRTMLNIPTLFNNEAVIYSEVLPEFEKLQKSADVPKTEQYQYPKYYGANMLPPNEIILLEDLKERGFDMQNKWVSLTDDEIRSILRNLAKFHSLSFALRTTKPEIFDALKVKLRNMWVLINDQAEAQGKFEKQEVDIKNLMDNEEDKKYLQGSVSQILSLSASGNAADLQSRYSVIIQGDCWTNNLMFKQEEGKFPESIMIDYQISVCASPAVDIMYLIFNCTDEATRTNNYQDWIDYYHQCLDDNLKYHGLKASEVYPRDRLDADLRNNGKLLFGISVLLLTVLSKESDETVDFKTMTNEEDAHKNAENFIQAGLSDRSTLRIRTRLEELIRSFREYDYI